MADNFIPQDRDRTLISVIIPVLNEEKVIGECLDSLVRQTLTADRFEVIVVDNGSVDRTCEITKAYERSLNLKLLQKRNAHISALRNLGASCARGAFLAFLDADCLAPSNWLSRAVELLRRGDGGVIGAFYTIPEGSSWLAKAWYGQMATHKQGRVSYVPSGTLVISRNVFSSIGGFDETIPTSEDYELCQRVAAAGYDVLAFPELSTVHLGTPQTLSAFYRKQRWHGNGVRTEFFRNMLHPGFAKTVLQTAFTLLLMIASVAMIPVAVLTNKWSVLAIAPGILLLTSLGLASRAAVRRNSLNLVSPLTVAYLVYGIARSLSFVGLNGKRSKRSADKRPYRTCAESAPAE